MKRPFILSAGGCSDAMKERFTKRRAKRAVAALRAALRFMRHSLST